MKKVNRIFINIYFLFILVGCSVKPTQNSPINFPTLPPNPFDMQPSEVPDSKIGGYMIGPLDFNPFEGKPLLYEGKPIEISFEIKNGGPEKDIGLMFFVDGAVQPHKVISSSQTLQGVKSVDEEQILSIHRLSFDEHIQITIQFTPVTGKKGEVLSFNRLAMLKPSFLPATENESFGIFQDGNPADFGTIELKVDAPTQLNSPKVDVTTTPIPENMKHVYEGNPTGRVLTPFYFFNDGTRDYVNKIYLNDGKVNLRVQIGGGAAADFRVTIFVNHVPVQVNGQKDFIIQSIYDNIVTYEFVLNLPDLPQLNSLYMTVLPVSDGYLLNPDSGFKTGSILLVNSLHNNSLLPTDSDPQSLNTPTQSEVSAIPLPIQEMDLSASLISNSIASGDILFLSTLDESTVLLALGDKFITLDPDTGTILDEIPSVLMVEPSKVNFFSHESGFSVLDHDVLSESTTIHSYDSLLNETITINPIELSGIPSYLGPACSVSHSGSVLACPDNNAAILVTDVESKKLIYKFDLFSALGKKNLTNITLAFAGNDKYLAFTGVYASAESSDTPTTYGIIDLTQNRTLLNKSRYGLNDYFIQTTPANALFIEGKDVVDRSDGKVVLYDLVTNTEKLIQFSHDTAAGRESYTVSISPQGRFLTGIEYNTTPGLNGYQNVVVRVYDRGSLEVVKEISIGSSISMPKVTFTQNEDAILITFSETNNSNQIRLIRYRLH